MSSRFGFVRSLVVVFLWCQAVTSSTLHRSHLRRCRDSPVGQRWVALSADIGDSFYLSLLPLTCYVWRHLHSVEPIVFLTSAGAHSERHRHVLKWVRDMCGHVDLYRAPPSERLSTFTQSVRLGAFAADWVKPHDVVFTADADIWPISRSFWSQFWGRREDITIVNGGFYRRNNHGTNNSVAISYVGAKACVWADVVGDLLNESHKDRAKPRDWHRYRAELRTRTSANKQGEWKRQPLSIAASILGYGRAYHPTWDADDPHTKDASVQWSWDQTFMTLAIKKVVANGHLSIYLGEGLEQRRLDRANWNFTQRADQYSDAHLPVPLTEDGVWQKVSTLWYDMFPDATWVDMYRRQLCARR